MITKANAYRLFVAVVLIFSFLITQAKASDGGLVGNGGGAVVCYDPTSNARRITTSEVLDLYEARVINNQTLDPAIQKTGEWKMLARTLIERMGKVSEMRRQLYGMYLDRFEQESKILSNVNLGDVKDADYVAIPEGCKLEMVILQSKPRIVGNARYFINERLWNALDDFNKAVLVMHEIIYREALSYGHANSVRVRLLNGYLLSSDILKLSDPSEIMLFFQKLNFEYNDFRFVKIPGGMQQRAGMEIYWDNAYDRGTARSVVLQDRVILKIGKCSTDSCRTFEDFNPLRSIIEFKEANDVDLMDLEYELTLPEYFQATNSGSDGEMRLSYFNERLSLNSKENQTNDYFDGSMTSFASFKMIGKLKNHLKSKYAYRPWGGYRISNFRINNDFTNIELESKEQIMFTRDVVAGPSYFIESANSMNSKVNVIWSVDDFNHLAPQIECKVGVSLKPLTKDYCSLSIFRGADQIMMGVLFSEGDQGVVVNKNNQFLTGGHTTEIYAEKHLSQCKASRDNHCLEFTRDIVSNDMFIHSNEVFELNKYLSVSGKGTASELIVDVRAGTYPLFSNYNFKWVVIGGDKSFDCEYYSNGKYKNVIHTGDILFFNLDGSPDVDKSCGVKPLPIEKIIQATYLQYSNALRGAGL